MTTSAEAAACAGSDLGIERRGPRAHATTAPQDGAEPAGAACTAAGPADTRAAGPAFVGGAPVAPLQLAEDDLPSPSAAVAVRVRRRITGKRRPDAAAPGPVKRQKFILQSEADGWEIGFRMPSAAGADGDSGDVMAKDGAPFGLVRGRPDIGSALGSTPASVECDNYVSCGARGIYKGAVIDGEKNTLKCTSTRSSPSCAVGTAAEDQAAIPPRVTAAAASCSPPEGVT